MPKIVKEANLSRRAARSRLAVAAKPYFRRLAEGLRLGYRKSHGRAAWIVQWYLGKGKYGTANLDGRPDDVFKADDETVLDWRQAQKKARQFFQEWQRVGAGRRARSTGTSRTSVLNSTRNTAPRTRSMKRPAAPHADSIPGVPNGPKQKRSRASVIRMLKAAAELMKEEGGRSLTLVDVSRRGKVSISSIYSRFDSKEALIRSALSRVVEEIDVEQREMLTKAVRGARQLRPFIPRLIDGMLEFIRDNGSILRVLTERAASHAESRHLAAISYRRSLAQVSEVLLRYRDEITCPDPERAVQAIFRIVYATAAGFLGFGQGFDKGGNETWLQMKRDLEVVCILLLTAAIRTATATPVRSSRVWRAPVK